MIVVDPVPFSSRWTHRNTKFTCLPTAPRGRKAIILGGGDPDVDNPEIDNIAGSRAGKTERAGNTAIARSFRLRSPKH